MECEYTHNHQFIAFRLLYLRADFFTSFLP